MYGYAAMLGPEASNIVQYLVSEVGLNQTAPSGQISERLGMSETELGDGLTELEQLDTITVHGPYITNAHIQPKGAAWLYVDAETLGYDLQGDMLAVAESTDNRSEARPQDIESDTGLSPERLSIAASTCRTAAT